MSKTHSAYLYVKSHKIGHIKGWTKHDLLSVKTNPAVEGGATDVSEMILVSMADQTITRPVQSGIGTATGQAAYGTLDCILNFDESTCSLFKAMLESHNLPKVGLYFWHEGQKRLADDGVMDDDTNKHNRFSIELVEAKLTAVNLAVSESSTVQVSFSYRKIVCINHDNKNAPAVFDWKTPSRD